MSQNSHLLLVVYALAGAIVGAVLGAALQYLLDRVHGAKRRLTSQKDVAYADFFTALSLFAKGDASNDWRSRMADAKVRICLYGAPRVIEDAAWIRGQLERLTAAQERHRHEPCAVDDAPAAFVDAQIRALVGLEIPIARLEGKWKTSQNRPEPDRLGVVAGLEADG